ncbi:Peptidoglycan-synthesis MurG C-terminal domain protein [Lyticum sinuosum]|uniref:Peptidoglycan-synthesis MurG C-terminal domain protein n=2 Tax=Lyticum sinuosum TaxID=1332059 RepID=A0AAE5AGR7_9RICK|nr:Peptidoglycan-synthesis MurG C-terminal domain protein [Lyticum sinuosum]
MKKNKINLVILFGSYIALPVALAAFIMRISIVIHEQNAILGLSNSIISHFADKITVSFKETIGISKKNQSKVIFCGMPIRDKFYSNLIKHKYNHNNDINIVILGGSLGSDILSLKIAEIILSLDNKIKSRINIYHQVKEEHYSTINKLYLKSNLKSYKICVFFNDLEIIMSLSDLIISRSGASSIAEIEFLGKPSILIPLKNSARNHQYINAQVYSNNNNSTIIIEEDNLEIKLMESFDNLFIKDQIKNLQIEAQKYWYKTKGAENLATIIGQILINKHNSRKIKY